MTVGEAARFCVRVGRFSLCGFVFANGLVFPGGFLFLFAFDSIAQGCPYFRACFDRPGCCHLCLRTSAVKALQALLTHGSNVMKFTGRSSKTRI